MLYALCGAIPARERVITVGEIFELAGGLPNGRQSLNAASGLGTVRAVLTPAMQVLFDQLVSHASGLRPEWVAHVRTILAGQGPSDFPTLGPQLVGLATNDAERTISIMLSGGLMHEQIIDIANAGGSTAAPAEGGGDDLADLLSQMRVTSSALASAHATAEYELLQATRKLAAECSDPAELETLARAYSLIPPVDMDEFDPPGDVPDWGLGE